MARPSGITELLSSGAAGNSAADNELFRLVYAELKAIARSHLRKSGRAVTINPTTLVHEAWLKFSRLDKGAIQGAAHFYNIVAQAMRHILHDLVARKHAIRHGGMLVRADLTDRMEQEDKPLDELIAVDAALEQLRSIDPDLCMIVEWHYFVGLSITQIAELTKVSERTTKRHLAMARALLHDLISGSRCEGSIAKTDMQAP